ncbi:MAG: T9SS type A sorting domain-containing protein [Bacteroidota bacterium]|nr:T9SS type A sorting domain-containing protein [Bacteroidota bacterium]
MKTTLSIFGTTICLFTFAQIPNSGFETWTTVGSYTNPTSWGTMNNTTSTFSVYSATPGTPGSPGNSYLKLTSKTLSTSIVNGIAVSGVLDSITMKPKSGFPCTLQPVSFTGKWQHMIYGSSQGSVKATLTKWNTSLNKRDTIATAAQTLSGMAMSWANFSLNFSYFSSNVPDSCIIELRSSGSNPTNNDYLWVDNLAFAGSVTGVEKRPAIIYSLIVYPNPSAEFLNINLNLKSPQNIIIELTDISGKLMRSKNAGILSGETFQSFDVSGIAQGTYLLKVVGEKATETKKIIIE